MRSFPLKWLLTSALTVGATIALRRRAAVREHRRRILRGEIRPVVSEWVDVGAWRIHARAALPPRPPLALPVVLVHGFGASGAYFVRLMEYLGINFVVYAPDLPGHGRSDPPAEPLDIPRFADSLIAWMEAMSIPRASLVGADLGCQIIVDAALRYPDRVARLVMIGPTVEPDARRNRELLRRFLRDSTHERPSLTAMLAKDYLHMGTRLKQELRFMQLDPIEVKLPDITAPTLLVRGENDPIASQEWVEQAARLAGHERVTVLPRLHHAVHDSAPAALAETITPFLLEVRQNGRPTAGIGTSAIH